MPELNAAVIGQLRERLIVWLDQPASSHDQLLGSFPTLYGAATGVYLAIAYRTRHEGIPFTYGLFTAIEDANVQEQVVEPQEYDIEHGVAVIPVRGLHLPEDVSLHVPVGDYDTPVMQGEEVFVDVRRLAATE
jgi:hypothetical protein